MCKPYVDQLLTAKGKVDQIMNYFKGEYACKNRNASNWRGKEVDYYVLYKSMSKIKVWDQVKK